MLFATRMHHLGPRVRVFGILCVLLFVKPGKDTLKTFRYLVESRSH